MRNVLIFVTGIGLGDAVREYAIINELKKIEEVRVRIAAYGMSKKFFENKFKTIEIRGFNAVSERFNLEFNQFVRSNATLPLTWKSQIKKLQVENAGFKPDLVVTDFEPLGVLFSRSTGAKFIGVFGVEPKSFEEFFSQRKGTVLFHRMQANYLRNMYKAGSVYGEGVIVPSITKAKSSEKIKIVDLITRESKEKSSLGKGKIVIILGGSTFGTALGKILLKVLPKIEEDFVIFGFDKPKEKIENVEFKPISVEALQYIKNSRGVITLAGHTTISEALVFRKPLLSFPIPNHIEQEYNGYILRKNKLGTVKELQTWSKEQYLIECINEFLQVRAEIKKNLIKADFRGDGAKQAAKIISKSL